MQELLQQVIAYARSAWRFRWPAIGVAWAVCLVGWLVVSMLEDVYEAKASVYVDTTSELRRLLDEQIVEPNVQARLEYVRQALTGREQLEEVARSNDLLLSARSAEDTQRILDRLAQNIQIQAVAPARNQAPNLYTISYQHEDRGKAISVVRTLLDTFVESMLSDQQSSSETSRRFLVEQIREYEQRLATAENRLAEFNRENVDRLPGREGGYFARLQAETEKLDQAQQALRQATSRKERIEQQLRGEAPQVSPRGEIDPNSIEGRIRQHQTRLDNLLLQYTENHPDVIAVKETLNRLKQQQQEVSELMAGGDLAVPSNNPVYQALMISLNEIEAEIATLQADVDNRQRRVQELRGVIDEMPDVEAELARLNRDYDVMQAQYQSLLNSLERQRLSRDAQTAEKIDFRIIDPPAADSQPVAPLRFVFVPLVLMLGVGAGAAFALFMSLLQPVISTPWMLEMLAGRPVLGAVGYRWWMIKQPGRLRGVMGFVLACIALVAVFSGVFVIEVFGPGFRNLV